MGANVTVNPGVNNFVNMGKEWKDSVNKLHPYAKDQKIDSDLLSNIVNS